MAYGESNGHVTDDVAWPRKVKIVTTIRSQRNRGLSRKQQEMPFSNNRQLLHSLLWSSTVGYLGDSLASCFYLQYSTFTALHLVCCWQLIRSCSTVLGCVLLNLTLNPAAFISCSTRSSSPSLTLYLVPRSVWARQRLRISPPRFLAECRMKRLNQNSFVCCVWRCLLFLGSVYSFYMVSFNLSSVLYFPAWTNVNGTV